MITFKKAAKWQCKKCQVTFDITYDLGTAEDEVMLQLLDMHKTKSGDCSSPSGFQQMAVFVKHIETK